MRNLPESSVDAIVTDPPYGLSNTTPEQVADTIVRWVSGDREHLPSGKGFMGKSWDGFVPPVAVWDEAMRVLKPGGHVLSFAGTRTMDLMTLGLRLAGFEIRDSVAWLYGSGFSKSWNFSTRYKGQWCICSGNAVPLNHASDTEMPSLRNDIHPTPVARGEGENASMLPPMQRPVARGRMEETRPQGPSGMVKGDQRRLPGEDQGIREPLMEGRNLHRAGEGLPNGSDAGSSPSKGERVCGGTPASHGEDDWQARRATGGSAPHQPRQGRQQTGEPEAVSGPHVALDDGAFRGRPECARCGGLNPEYKGFGTGLKPSHEPVVVARKPMATTVAANVLEHGTGAINIDACRIEGEPTPINRLEDWSGFGQKERPAYSQAMNTKGRWPANVILDEHMAGVLDQQSGVSKSPAPYVQQSKSVGIYGAEKHHDRPSTHHGDSGGASRFFYVAKAPKRERPEVNGVKHATVKPLTLMRYLVRMVTPPNGIVLDPFAGSGTTIEAALLEGFQSVGIELTDEYLPLIQQRIQRQEVIE